MRILPLSQNYQNTKFKGYTPIIGKPVEIEKFAMDLSQRVGQNVVYHIDNITKHFNPVNSMQSNRYTDAVKRGYEIRVLVTGKKAEKYQIGSSNPYLDINNHPIELDEGEFAVDKAVSLIKKGF